MSSTSPAQSALAPATLAATLWPARGDTAGRALRFAVLAVLGSAIMAISAQITVPLQPVPLTMQPFAVMLLGAAFGWRLGAATMALYLFEGAVLNLPVFANLKFGFPALLGPTGGYLVGFMFAAALIGWLAERGWDRHVASTILAMLAGILVIYGMGVAWLATLIGIEPAIANGILPFIYGDLIKAVLAALALPGAWYLVRKIR